MPDAGTWSRKKNLNTENRFCPTSPPTGRCPRIGVIPGLPFVKEKMSRNVRHKDWRFFGSKLDIRLKSAIVSFIIFVENKSISREMGRYPSF